jgi:hypothetical protein
MKYLLEDMHSKQCDFFEHEKGLREKITRMPNRYLKNLAIYELMDVTQKILWGQK